MVKRTLSIGVLVLGFIFSVTPMFDVASALTSSCFTCRNSPVEGLCMESQMTGMGNCDKSDQCCYLEVEINVTKVAGTCCNPAENCGGLGRAFWDANFGMGATDAIGQEDLFGKGKASSNLFWMSCEIYDRLFCKNAVTAGCYKYENDIYVKGSAPSNGFCDPGYSVYFYCTEYDPAKLAAVECHNGNPLWSPQPPQCPSSLNSLWSMTNTGSIKIMDMIATYEKWSFKETDGTCAYPPCPKESLVRHYWLDQPDQTVYSYDPDEDYTAPCP